MGIFNSSSCEACATGSCDRFFNPEPGLFFAHFLGGSLKKMRNF